MSERTITTIVFAVCAIGVGLSAYILITARMERLLRASERRMIWALNAFISEAGSQLMTLPPASEGKHKLQ